MMVKKKKGALVLGIEINWYLFIVFIYLKSYVTVFGVFFLCICKATFNFMGLVQNILYSQLGKANPRRIEIGKE